MIARHRRRFLQRNLRPCPYNCKMADMMGRKIIGCSGCESHNPNQCLKEQNFVPIATKDELIQQFKEEVRDPGILLRDYRDLVVFFWVLGAFDEEKQVNEDIVSKVEEKPNSKKASNGQP
jgi:hypothetical protein